MTACGALEGVSSVAHGSWRLVDGEVPRFHSKLQGVFGGICEPVPGLDREFDIFPDQEYVISIRGSSDRLRPRDRIKPRKIRRNRYVCLSEILDRKHWIVVPDESKFWISRVLDINDVENFKSRVSEKSDPGIYTCIGILFEDQPNGVVKMRLLTRHRSIIEYW
jgi:hypothetical protein